MINELKLYFVSDTHCYMHMVVPHEADILIHCGDALIEGTMPEFAKFARDLGRLKDKYKHILYIPGNHDIIVEKEPEICKVMLKESGSNIHMLYNESIELEGLNFYGSPHTPMFYNGAFMYEENEAERIWSKIPEGTDILVTHGMPFGFLDNIPMIYRDARSSYESVGCPVLTKHVKRVKPLIYAGGHIHFRGGQVVQTLDTLYINAAVYADSYIVRDRGVVVTVDPVSKRRLSYERKDRRVV